MKVTLRNSYSYNQVHVQPEVSTWDEDMQVEMDTKDVMEILALQVQFEALQQRLMPLYKACEEKRKATEEAKKLERNRKRILELQESGEDDDELNKLLAEDPEFAAIHSEIAIG